MIAEFWAIKYGLRLAHQLGIRALFVELDAEVVFDLIWGSADENMVLNPLILDCRKMRGEFMASQANHFFRLANWAAGFLAHLVKD